MRHCTCQTNACAHQRQLIPSQAVELKVTSVAHVGACDASTYPMAKKKQSFEFLREKAHLRPRTNTIGAVARIRNALAFATHKCAILRLFTSIRGSQCLLAV